MRNYGLTRAKPGTYEGLYLITSDIVATRAELLSREVDVSEPFHFGPKGRTPGLHPERADELPPEEVGPFMCAGVTVYNALRNSGARGGHVVAVLGIGGLGHFGVQYARRMGFVTVALGRGTDMQRLAEKLGAHHYFDTNSGDTVAKLQKLGRARIILATAPNAKAISALVEGLSPDGNLLIPAAPDEPLIIPMMPLIAGRRSVAGWYSGTAKDSQDLWNSAGQVMCIQWLKNIRSLR